MTRNKAVVLVTEVARQAVGTMPLRKQIEFYEALSFIMPTEAERNSAEEIAISLSEVEKLQLDFTRQIFSKNILSSRRSSTMGQARSAHHGKGDGK